MILTRNRKLLLAAAASATALGVAAPAAAGGYYGHVGYSNHYYGGHHGYYGHRGYRHRGYHRRHHGGGGGKAAAIALGVIGGAIILNEVAESRAERRAYEARYYDRYDRYDRYARRAQPAYDREAFKRGYEEGYSEGRAADLEAGVNPGAPRDLSNGPSRKDDLDARLDGGPEPIRFSAAEAYQTCMTHARTALGDRGFMLAAPPAPDTAEDTGGAWKMTATVSAQNPAGESWSRAMYCEADESRVYLLELI